MIVERPTAARRRPDAPPGGFPRRRERLSVPAASTARRLAGARRPQPSSGTVVARRLLASNRRGLALPLAALLAACGFAVAAGDAAGQATGPPTIARLQYDGGGDWYANPSSLPNLLAAVRERAGIATANREAVVRPGDPSLRDYPFVYMTGHGNVRFSPEQRDALRAFLLDGGFLHADDNYGMDDSFRREMALLFPDKPMVELPPDHPVFRAPYRLPGGLPKVHEHDGGRPQAFGIFHEGRLAVLYTYESDLGDGWEDAAVHDDSPAVREAALQMGVNIFVFAMRQAAWAS